MAAAFMDELFDAFGDDVDFGASTHKNVHPYLPKVSSEVADSTSHDKLIQQQATELIQQQATELSQDAVESLSERTAPCASEPRPYLPSASGKHHRYLPLPKASEKLAKDSNQDKCEISSDVVTSDDGEKILTATAGEAKPFRRPNSLHSYLCQLDSSASTSEEVPLDSSAVADEKENRDHAAQDLVEKGEVSPVEKLDIDAMLAALPQKLAESEKGVSCRITKYAANPESVLEANPELQGRITSFLCHEMKGRNWPQRDFANGMQFQVPVQ